MCDVTMERFARTSPQAAPQEIGRAQLVALLNDLQEQFSWRDGGEIEEALAMRLIGSAVRSVDFIAHSRALLTRKESSFAAPAGDQRFQFAVPAKESEWLVPHGASGTIRLGYAGTAWYDFTLLRKLQLTATGKELQPLGLSKVVKTLQYGWLRGPGDVAALVSGEGEIRYVERNGAEEIVRTHFENCRPLQALKVDPAPAIKLPADFQVPVELVTPVDSTTAFADDTVAFRLLAPVYFEGGVLQAGDPVDGRISRQELVDGRRRLQFAVMSIGSVPVHSRRNNVGLKAGEADSTFTASGERLELPTGTKLILRSTAR